MAKYDGIIGNREQAIRLFKRIEEIGYDKPWGIKLTNEKVRTTVQNARHWAILTQIAYWRAKKGEDYAPETWHEFFKQKFLEPDVSIIEGGVIVKYHSKGESTIVFSDFDELICAWAGEREITILDKEQWQEFKQGLGETVHEQT